MTGSIVDSRVNVARTVGLRPSSWSGLQESAGNRDVLTADDLQIEITRPPAGALPP